MVCGRSSRKTIPTINNIHNFQASTLCFDYTSVSNNVQICVHCTVVWVIFLLNFGGDLISLL